jgi:hypothetical protein
VTAVATSTRERVAYRRPTTNHGQHGAVIRAIAHQLGRKPSTVRDWISGHHQLGPVVAAIIAGLQEGGDRERAERVFAPIRAAMARIPAAPLTDALFLQQKTAEGDEDVALVAYLRRPSASNRQRLVHELDVERTLNLELRQSLATESSP